MEEPTSGGIRGCLGGVLVKVHAVRFPAEAYDRLLLLSGCDLSDIAVLLDREQRLYD